MPALDGASGTGHWLLVQRMRLAWRHTLPSRELRHPTDHFSELGEGLQVPGPAPSISFNLPVKRHLKYLPANLEKFSLQGTDIQSEDNGSFAAKRWSECPARVIVTLLSIP